MSSEPWLLSKRWPGWIAALGPGTIVASLTIGTGELVFSSRAGALFGYRILGLFVLVLLLKWALVFASARHWVLSDAHPLDRWSALPGPRGWLPWMLIVLAVPAFPVWVSFHAGTIGTLIASLTGTGDAFSGGGSLAWGLLVLAATLLLSLTGGYTRLEKTQAAVVCLLVLAVLVAWLRLSPDWPEIFHGLGSFHRLEYPAWATSLNEFAARPVWLEAATYVGVIGGSGYDYLAYVAWLRDKHGPASTRKMDADSLRKWVLLDASLSFVTVLVVSTAFVGCGDLILRPQQQVPTGTDLLTLQAQFVHGVGSWLRPLYFTGAFLALGGTLYGTMEVAPAVLRQMLEAVARGAQPSSMVSHRRWAIGWCGGGGILILATALAWRWKTGATNPLDLVALVTPANLLTGVLACGWMSFLNLWADRRFLPRSARMNTPLAILNLLGGVIFTGAGIRGAWEQGRWTGLWILAGGILAGCVMAALTRNRPSVRTARA
jgi:hypothetical protein